MNGELAPTVDVETGDSAAVHGTREVTGRRFAGQTALVTGGAQGLGRAITRRLAMEGALVHVADRDEATLTAMADAAIDLAPGRIIPHTLDIGHATDVSAWVDACAADGGHIDILINNAGIIRDNRVEHITDTDWDDVLRVNLSGAFYGVRAAFPYMKAAGYGRIISFSSMSWRGNYGQANYVAAKAGIVGMTRTIALEGAAHDITANAIAPGLIETPMLASMNSRAREKLVGKIPMRRTGRPQDVASAVAFLASRDAGYITGVVLDVDGGISIGSSIR